jgi:hypothetical protein
MRPAPRASGNRAGLIRADTGYIPAETESFKSYTTTGPCEAGDLPEGPDDRAAEDQFETIVLDIFPRLPSLVVRQGAATVTAAPIAAPEVTAADGLNDQRRFAAHSDRLYRLQTAPQVRDPLPAARVSLPVPLPALDRYADAEASGWLAAYPSLPPRAHHEL